MFHVEHPRRMHRGSPHRTRICSRSSGRVLPDEQAASPAMFHVEYRSADGGHVAGAVPNFTEDATSSSARGRLPTDRPPVTWKVANPPRDASHLFDLDLFALDGAASCKRLIHVPRRPGVFHVEHSRSVPRGTPRRARQLGDRHCRYPALANEGMSAISSQAFRARLGRGHPRPRTKAAAPLRSR